MQAYDFDHLSADMTSWLQNRYLAPIAYQNYGWEYWIQIDFVAWLDSHYGVQYDFMREAVVPNARLDWLANSNTGGPQTAVEIKAQTVKGNLNAFLQSVAADVAKLGTVGGMANRLMLVGVVDQAAADALVPLGYVEIAMIPEVSIYALNV